MGGLIGIPCKASFLVINMALPAQMRSQTGEGTRQSLAIFVYFDPQMTFSRRAVQKIPKLEVCSSNLKNYILSPSIGKILQLSFRVHHET
jgi:hypothetical protein